MGLKDWFERLRNQNKGFVYKLDEESKTQAVTQPKYSEDNITTLLKHYENNGTVEHTSTDDEVLEEDDAYEESEYEEDDPEQEFDKAQFMQRSVPIDHVIKVCISTYYDQDDETDEFEDDIEYAYFLTNYKVSTIVKEAGKLVDIKCLQLTGDDMGTVYDDCAFDVYEDDEDCHTPALIISWTENGMYGYSDYYYKNDNLQESYSAVHEEICTNLSGLIDPETNTVQILGLVQLSNSFNFQANQDKYDRRDSLESEKKEVEEFFGSEDE
ncbi:MAG: hypothetical protein J6J23_01505 [Clostridia bacterium]|nr:hypothetical protein [Clostridia bacterium]